MKRVNPHEFRTRGPHLEAEAAVRFPRLVPLSSRQSRWAFSRSSACARPSNSGSNRLVIAPRASSEEALQAQAHQSGPAPLRLPIVRLHEVRRAESPLPWSEPRMPVHFRYSSSRRIADTKYSIGVNQC
jgi:hypothetical protein